LIYLRCESNSLECLNLKNCDYNSLILKAKDNYTLFCIDVDDSAFCTNNFKTAVDSWTRFSEDCGNLGINENALEKSIIVYPNPNNGSFRIKESFKKPSEMSIFITNTLGIVVYKGFDGSVNQTLSGYNFL